MMNSAQNRSQNRTGKKPPSAEHESETFRLVENLNKGAEKAAPKFLSYELGRLESLSASMRNSDYENGLEFQLFFERGAQPDSTGLERKQIAARLCVKPETLRRWSCGEHIPFPIPRESYLRRLADLVDDFANQLEANGVQAVLEAPRRGSRKRL